MLRNDYSRHFLLHFPLIRQYAAPPCTHTHRGVWRFVLHGGPQALNVRQQNK